ncbi:MAG TPA: glycoside hydrolase family 2 protein [Chitinophagaceae bacterium]|nr:glycoside hydrolase family 2 protein [Chitinophagaceae bacterium]
MRKINSKFWAGMLLVLPLSLFAQTNSWSVKNDELQDHWQIQSSAKVSAGGDNISTLQFKPVTWYDAKIPNSTLGTLVDDGVFKNIFFNRNLEEIPDSLFNVPWWYRRTFTINDINPGQVYRLRFNGISYSADVWLNGTKIASADTIKGSFRQFIFDITPYIKKGENVLALQVAQAGPGDLNIGFVDWNPEPADNNMGIWRDVHLEETGPVSIDQPFVITDVDTATLDHANVTIKVILQNHSDKNINGTLNTIIGNYIPISKKVSLEANETKEIVLRPEDYKTLSIDHPKLWWTHDLGEPNLYSLEMNFETDHKVSDVRKLKFGIRSVSGYMTDKGFRAYRLNGKKILIKGGGWTDPMLLRATPEYEEAGIDYAVHMNFNALRMEGFWGENQHIYDLCDEKGILLMVGFSCQWEWKGLMRTATDDKYGVISTPEQIEVATKSLHDQVVWLRNHPSIFLWLYGSDKWPRPALETNYLNVLTTCDNTRPYAQSAKEWVSEITGPTGMKMRGPYDYVPPDYWYIDTTYGGAFGFNTETGPGPEVPVLESLEKMIPKDSLWPIGSSWLYHAARGQFHNLSRYNNAMDERLGAPSSIEDYERKAQYLNYEGMRAMYEAFEANRFTATGIIQWMYNASWPKLWWQLYDYYLMPTGALYGARLANEPLHVSYNYGNNAVDVMNNTGKTASALTAEINVLNFDLKSVLKKTVSVQAIASGETKEVFTLPADLTLSKTYFLDLKLYNQHHENVSNNFYVLSTEYDSLDVKKSTWFVTPQTHYADLTLLQQLPKVKLQTGEITNTENGRTMIHVKVKNPTSHLAFMVYMDIKKGDSNASAAPVFWSDNYFTLLPGEERIISVWCHTSDLEGKQPKVVVGGWNAE